MLSEALSGSSGSDARRCAVDQIEQEVEGTRPGLNGDDRSRMAEARCGVWAEAQGVAPAHVGTSELRADFPTFFLWMPDCETHSGVYDDPTYFRSRIEHGSTNFSLREWVERFAVAPRHGASEWRIHDYPGLVPMRSDCR